MKLGDLIESLSAMNADDPVEFADGTVPWRLCSWRGIYGELTIDSRPGGYTTVGELLAEAREAVGKTFTGYKGGEYTMSLETPVWADQWGDYQCMAPTGFLRTQGKVRITTMDLSDYR